jgi:hypothetical protein
VHAVRFWSVRFRDGDNILHDLPGRCQLAHDWCICVDELRQLCGWTIFIGVGSGRRVQLVRFWFVCVVPGQYRLHLVRSWAVCLPNWVDAVHELRRRHIPRLHGCLLVDQLHCLSSRAIFGGHGTWHFVRELYPWSVRRRNGLDAMRELCGGLLRVRNRDCDLHKLRSRVEPGDDRRVGIGELLGMWHGVVLRNNRPCNSLSELCSRSILVVNGFNGLYGLRGWSVHVDNGHGYMYGVCCRVDLADHGRNGVNELHRMLSWAVLVGSGTRKRM